ncbi:hypothetical protein LTC53_01905 [Xanthomonas translucens pv. undulosa]|nr:hypothetical protein [Xanthomonas translucens]UJB15481.1 hypothetical protein LTC53_01905 [Xanthomonas translucens pv. undulosa]WLA05117.1 hypothetical protein MO329_01750 [Xanthomonas translucens]
MSRTICRNDALLRAQAPGWLTESTKHSRPASTSPSPAQQGDRLRADRQHVLGQALGRRPARIEQAQAGDRGRPLQRDLPGHRSAARVTDQMHRLSVAGEERGDLLRVPTPAEGMPQRRWQLREILAQAQRGDLEALGQAAQLRRPIAVVAQRAVYQHHRGAVAEPQVGQRIVVAQQVDRRLA